jgi:hypothetical protein
MAQCCACCRFFFFFSSFSFLLGGENRNFDRVQLGLVGAQEQLLEALSFFLVRVPEREAEADKPVRPASTIFPRYHQSRLVRRVAEDITAHFAKAGDIGKKYLADHSAGSGKTLSICWLASRLHSLFKPGTNEKLVDITFILTDRKSLDTNIREDIEKFTELWDEEWHDAPLQMGFLEDDTVMWITGPLDIAEIAHELEDDDNSREE